MSISFNAAIQDHFKRIATTIVEKRAEGVHQTILEVHTTFNAQSISTEIRRMVRTSPIEAKHTTYKPFVISNIESKL